MMLDDDSHASKPPEDTRLARTGAAERALAEAAARRVATETAPEMKEINGRGGLEPVRYGDWEVKGLTSDF